MYNILLVDDERKERKIVKILLERMFAETFNFNEAESGEEALTILEEGSADIVFMDIQMPGIDGLEVIRRIRKINDSIYVVVLTAYNYFDYAKEALELKVDDFLLKPLIRDELTKAIQKFSTFHEKEREKSNTKELLSKHLASLLIYGSNDSLEVKRYLNLLNIREEYGYCISFGLKEQLDKTRTFSPELTYWFQNFGEKLEDQGIPYVSKKVGSRFIYFLFTDNSNNIIEKDKMNCLIAHHEKNENLILPYSIGHIHECGKKLENSFFDAYANSSKEHISINTLDYEKLLSHKLQEGFLESAKTILRDIIVNMCMDLEINRLKFKIGDILTGVTKRCLPSSERESLLDEIPMIVNINVLDDINNFAGNYLNQLDERIKAINNIESHHIIDRIVAYIEEHYMDNLTIEMLAKKYYISTFYLSKLFKEKRNKTFTDYLSDVRIQKVIDLMKTELSIKEIADQVGYKDANYFSRVFKKKTGMSPSRYRKEKME